MTKVLQTFLTCKSWLILAFVCLIVPATVTGQERVPRILDRILQGQETSDYPAVGIVGSERNGEFCTGTLISTTHVLTAAHCAEVIEGATRGTFRLGDQVYETEAVLIHPDYNGDDFANDIAVLRLAEPVLDVEPSQLFRGTPLVGDLLIIVGFGGGGTATSGGDGSFGTKRFGLTTIDNVTDTMVNWTFDDPAEANTVSGDSGGPGYLDIDGSLFVTTITSGGTVLDSALGDMAFNTRVDAFASWIDATMADDPTAPTDPTEPEENCDFWGQPFPLLQFLINLLTSLYEYFTDDDSGTVTDPPVTDPPATDPPVTDPPVTDPPVTDPPVTDPPVTNPPVINLPVTGPLNPAAEVRPGTKIRLNLGQQAIRRPQTAR
jgi:Trypsin